MARPPDRRAPASPAADPESLGLREFSEPDDQGISLDELSQAYAALLGKGADPYSARAQGDQQSPEEPAADALPATQEAEEYTFEITPRGILEAILFVGHPSGEPLTSERIATLMRGVHPGEIDELVAELNSDYDAAGTPYTITSVGPGYQLALRSEYASLRDVFYGRIREARLSQAAIDVLAIVAYHQPVAAEVIDRLRGKPSGAILSQLLRRELVSIERPAAAKAKPAYKTTGRFLEIFGLDGLADLPQSEDGGR